MNKTKRMATARRPAWTQLVSITTCIEGFDLGPDGLVVRKELAAQAHADSQKLLSVIWKWLTPATRNALEAAWERELQGAPLRADRSRRSQAAPTTASDGHDGIQ